MRLAAALAVLLATAAAPAGAATGPTLRLVSTTPFVVHGAGFKQGESVRVTGRIATKTWVRTVQLTTTRFTVRLGSGTDVCGTIGVTAVGSRGDRASLKIVTECPPLQPLDPTPKQR